MENENLLYYTKEEKTLILSKYGRTIHSIKDDVEAIKSWITKQPHIPEIPDDNRIENLLYMSKFVFQKTKELVDCYYTFKHIVPNLFQDSETEKMKMIFDNLYAFPLPKLTHKQGRVLFYKQRTPTLDVSFDGDTYIAHCINLADVMVKEDCPNVKVIFYDCNNLTGNIISLFSPTLIKNGVKIFENVFSNSISEIHVLNLPTIVITFVKIIKNLINPKIAKRIYLHNSVNTLFESIPQEVLPLEYGGTERSLEELHDLWRQKLKELSPWFKQRNALISNQSLRQKEMNNSNLGIQGNFRKLNID